jgi:S-(hydroxymethyl)glutathione dehydrogenase/alcohol dehydrogenase
VEEVGEGVTRVRPGDHVVVIFTPTCGSCRFCASGQSYICDYSANILTGSLPDGTFRFHEGIDRYGAMPGTFCERVTLSEFSVVPISKEIPLDVASLLSCGVPTGWGSSVLVGGAKTGDTVVVYGSGGVGINAVQGAYLAGARYVVAVDPVPFKREMALELGASHVAGSANEAHELLLSLTGGVGADVAVVTTGSVDTADVKAAFDAIRKGGVAVLTGTKGSEAGDNIHLSGTFLTWFHKSIKGAVYGGINPQSDIPMLGELYLAGRLKLDELITSRFRLEEINRGYQELREGKNIRGIIDFSLG